MILYISLSLLLSPVADSLPTYPFASERTCYVKETTAKVDLNSMSIWYSQPAVLLSYFFALIDCIVLLK